VINATSLLYIYGVLLAFGVWLTRSIFFSLHVRRAKQIDHPQLIRALEIWRRRLDVEPHLEIRTSDAVSSVCVYGIFRPVIIVPSDLNARISFEDLVMMCAHELAHVKRGDCRLFAASAAARILFWFNPFVKRIAARAELAAEQSADALVLNFGADRRAYAACFVEGLRFAAERAQVSRVAVPQARPARRHSFRRGKAAPHAIKARHRDGRSPRWRARRRSSRDRGAA
jgi:beta-lactamase regulating signal transducer with metallopeptidase domain